jgi:hypothetical protein
MLLAEHGLRKHFEFPQSLHNAHDIKLIHKLFLCFIKQEMLLIAFRAPIIPNISDADTSDRILKDVKNREFKPRTV